VGSRRGSRDQRRDARSPTDWPSGESYSDGFAAKLDGAGELVWAWGLSGEESDGCLAVALDAAGNGYVACSFMTAASLFPYPSPVTGSGFGDVVVARVEGS
jgi:hypothetical protein